jgi:hypothetical protein
MWGQQFAEEPRTTILVNDDARIAELKQFSIRDALLVITGYLWTGQSLPRCLLPAHGTRLVDRRTTRAHRSSSNGTESVEKLDSQSRESYEAKIDLSDRARIGDLDHGKGESTPEKVLRTVGIEFLNRIGRIAVVQVRPASTGCRPIRDTGKVNLATSKRPFASQHPRSKMPPIWSPRARCPY